MSLHTLRTVTELLVDMPIHSQDNLQTRLFADTIRWCTKSWTRHFADMPIRGLWAIPSNTFRGQAGLFADKLYGSVKELNILIYFFFHPSLNGVLFPMFCLLVEGKCQILVF